MEKKPIAKAKPLNDLLQSGDFTLVYHDNGEYEIYTGKYKDYDSIDYNHTKPFHSSDQYMQDGYIPTEVEVLVKALGGKVFTI